MTSPKSPSAVLVYAGLLLGAVITLAPFALGLLTFGLWLAALVPPSLWPRLARSMAWLLLGGCIFGLVVSGFATATTPLWRPLGQATLKLVSVLLGLTGAEVVSDLDDMSIGTATFTVQILPGCSGYEPC